MISKMKYLLKYTDSVLIPGRNDTFLSTVSVS